MYDQSTIPFEVRQGWICNLSMMGPKDTRLLSFQTEFPRMVPTLRKMAWLFNRRLYDRYDSALTVFLEPADCAALD
jgi:hypothetical protein